MEQLSLVERLFAVNSSNKFPSATFLLSSLKANHMVLHRTTQQEEKLTEFWRSEDELFS